MIRAITLSSLLLALAGTAAAADWPTAHGNNQRTGFTADEVRPPYTKAWDREFPMETLATRIEAIVADGRVFVGTLQGSFHALDAATGEVLWTHACGPVLNNAAAADGKVVFGDTDRTLWCLNAADGSVAWRLTSGKGGFAAAPLIADGTVYIGGRDGTFYAVSLADGSRRWSFATGGPIRNTAALAGEAVIFASDDMHAYSLAAADGARNWRSEPLYGQSFRDYYPVVAADKVIFRSVLVTEMNQDLNGGTAFLMRRAGAQSLEWGEQTSFPHLPEGVGTPEQHRAEQQAILERFEENPWRRTCFLLDLDTGRESVRNPVMYAAGNQGCGFPPALTADGRPILFYRTAYGHWQLGVKPAVGVGYLDPRTGWVEHIHHTSGSIPPWNTLWGTSDETTVFSVGGGVLYISHQGSLGALDLQTRKLSTVHGQRDTFGGMEAPPWAANEWHGPARGSAAIVDDRIYYVTGSRVLCIRGEGR